MKAACNTSVIPTDGSVESIGAYAFAHTGITSIVIPDSVAYIGEYAFYYCLNLASITLSPNINIIGNNAFNRCSALADVWVNGTEQPGLTVGNQNTVLTSATWHYTDGACDADCNDCGEVRIPSDHAYDNACDSTCNVCGVERSVTHNYEWVIDTNPTCGAVGCKHEECTICHTKRSENTEIPATGNHSYDNDADATCNGCSFERVVLLGIEIIEPIKTVYEIGEQADFGGLQIVLNYSNGTKETLTEGFTIIGFDSATAGKKTLTVTYGAFADTFTITVNRKISETDPQIIVKEAKGVIGKTVNVTISLKNNPGLASAKLLVEFDTNVLTLVGVKDEGKLGVQVHKPEFVSPYLLTWANDTATQNFVYDGVVVTLTFQIKEDAPVGEYPITVSYDYDNYDIMDCNMNKVNFAVVNGSVEVMDVLLGDVNLDGIVNTLDRALLTRYLAGWDGYTEDNVNLTAADVNMDGVVNTLDRAILTRHLAGWGGYETLPYSA